MNNPTIGGVSRELLERQEPVARCRQSPVRKYLSVELLRTHMKDGDLLYSAPPEVAALQSTIAQLQARIAELESGSKPVLIQAVAVTRDDEDEGLRLEWLLEGGISELECGGQVLFAMPEANGLCDENGSAMVYTAPPAPVVAVPEGYCIMPRRLTAENGAKALLLGEFKVTVTNECSECAELDDPNEHCEICDGEGEFGQRHTISWDQIKFIYSKAVEGLAIKTPAASRLKS